MKKVSIGKIVLLTALAVALLVSANIFLKPDNLKAEDVIEVKPKELDNSIALFVGSPTALKNNEIITIDEDVGVTPQIKNGTTLVPLRFVAEAFNAEISWDTASYSATITMGDKVIVIDSRGRLAYINGGSGQGVECDVVGGRVLVPVRFVSEALGKEVFYDRGLIIISDIKDVFDPDKDKDVLDNIIGRLNNLPIVGSESNFKELVDKAMYMEIEEDLVLEAIDDGGELGGSSSSTGAMPTASESARGESSNKEMASSDTATATQESQADYEFYDEADGDADYDADYSETNVQVAGVDEADIIKTDGQYIYYAKDNVVYIVEVNADGSLTLLNKYDTNTKNEGDYYELYDIFIDTNKLVLIGISAEESPYSYYLKYNTAVTVLNVSDKKLPVVEREFVAEGDYLQSRKIGSYVYLVTKSGGVYSDIMPMIKDTAVSNDYKPYDYANMRYIPDCPVSQLTSVSGINLDDPKEKAEVFSFLGSGSEIYVSADNLYIAAQFYRSDRNKDYQTTDIYKFSLNKGKATYLAKGTIDGALLNQFSMDEHKGYFRAATTIDSYSSGKYRRTNNVVVMDAMLNKVGEITDIAPGEKIYSARFMGDKAYVVTFETVDPLFVIDLSSPTNPKILGALKIPGYSDYLHPYDENHLIGFGKDTVEYGGNAYYKGMKISIFDVTDVSNPKEMFTEYIGDRGTESELLRNHKALLFSKERNLLAFPVSVYEIPDKTTNEALATDYILAYGQFAYQGAYVYNVDLTSGFTLKGRITHLTDEDYMKSSTYYADDNKFIDRIIFIKNNLYTFSKSIIKSNDINTIQEIGFLKLQD